MLARERAELGEIDELQHRVGRRLGPDHPRVRLHRGLQRAASVRSTKLKSSPALRRRTRSNRR